MAINKLEATREWVNNWRKENNVGPNVTPAKEVVPFKWMHPFLKKVESNGLQIAKDPSFTVGGSKGNKTNQKIIRSGDANAPNATEFMKIRNLGPAMFPIKKAEVNYGKEMPANYRQWSNQLQEILKKDKPNWLEEMKIHTQNYPTA